VRLAPALLLCLCLPALSSYADEPSGGSRLHLTQLWPGVHLLKELPKGISLQLFVGYDPIHFGEYLGSPKPAGAAFRATVIYPLF
jgi:hypothetical protein